MKDVRGDSVGNNDVVPGVKNDGHGDDDDDDDDDDDGSNDNDSIL